MLTNWLDHLTSRVRIIWRIPGRVIIKNVKKQSMGNTNSGQFYDGHALCVVSTFVNTACHKKQHPQIQTQARVENSVFSLLLNFFWFPKTMKNKKHRRNRRNLTWRVVFWELFYSQCLTNMEKPFTTVFCFNYKTNNHELNQIKQKTSFQKYQSFNLLDISIWHSKRFFWMQMVSDEILF